MSNVNDLSKLLNFCIEIYKSFNHETMSVDIHADDFVTQKDLDTDSSLFVKQVFFGIERYEKLLQCIIKCFMNQSKVALPSDKPLYLHIVYFIIFRSEDMSWKTFKALFLHAMAPSKLYSFMSFVLDEENIKTKFKEEILKYYDSEFVEETILPPLLNGIERLDPFMKFLYDKTFHSESKKVEPQESTKPEPFHLTEPKPKKIPRPEMFDTEFKANPVPETNEKPLDENVSKTIDDFSKGKMTSSVKSGNKKVLEPKPFQLATSQRPSKIDKVKQEVEKEREEEMKRHVKIKSNDEIKKVLNTKNEVRLTTAAILREDALYKEKQRKEMEELKKYQSELRDASEFFEWQQKMKELDEIDRQMEVEKRRMESQISEEEAKEARKKLVEKNHQEAEQMRKEIDMLREKLKRESQEEKEKKKRAAAQVKDSLNEVDHAKEKAWEEKAKTAKQRREERTVNQMKVARQTEIERRRKEDLIRQIKAAEEVPTPHMNTFDPAETSGVGLLTEMSLNQLKERLKRRKSRLKKEEELKRQQIVEQKKKKQEDLLSRKEQLSKYRNQAKKESLQRRIKAKQSTEEKKKKRQEEYEEKLLALQQKLEEKKALKEAEKNRINQELHQKEREKQLNQKDKNDLEKRKWEDMEKAAERKQIERLNEKAGKKDTRTIN
eukprot:gb/GECH01010549.1/.p1 GENE.gb/GECH01010549.1/~~gb/GECH01010549.1/.p1  ORF type:complete len:664 (+),score=239.59 gb/GECH01010549.1/:1-1992(+)